MQLSQFIDHTILKPQTTVLDINKLCTEANKYHFKAICVPPYFIEYAKSLVIDSGTLVATVVGFPFGYSNTEAKLAEVKYCLEAGADEIDMVINIIALKNGNYKYVANEIFTICEMVHKSGKCLKVIIESGILIDDEIIQCCKICTEAKVDFVKTSTGYAEVGATLHAVTLMRQNLPKQILIKASGGIRDKITALNMIQAGAARIGTSSGVNIVTAE